MTTDMHTNEYRFKRVGTWVIEQVVTCRSDTPPPDDPDEWDDWISDHAISVEEDVLDLVDSDEWEAAS